MKKYYLQCEDINKALEVNYTEEKGRFTVSQDNLLPGNVWKLKKKKLNHKVN